MRPAASNAPVVGRTLAAQNVRDGEILHLTPRYQEWPELEYDDVAEAIASGARRYGVAWSATATRVTGLVAGVCVLLGTLAVLLVFAQRGEISALRQKLSELRGDPFADSLHVLARNYRMERIREALERRVGATPSDR